MTNVSQQELRPLGKKKRNEKTAVRIGDEYLLFDHKTNENDGIVENTLTGDSQVEIKGKNIYIRNAQVGIEVHLKRKDTSVNVKYTNPTIAARSGGYCKACGRTDDCGIETEPDWQVDSDQIIWDQVVDGTYTNAASCCTPYQCALPPTPAPTIVADPVETPAPITPAPTDTILADPDVDTPAPAYPTPSPSVDEAIEDVMITTTPAPVVNKPSCRLRRRKLQDDDEPVVKPVSLYTCDVIETDCKNVEAGFFNQAMDHCRTISETHWWMVDCNCLRDVCAEHLLPAEPEIPDSPCQVAPMNEAHIVQHTDNYDYATLDFAAPNATPGQCHWDGHSEASTRPMTKIPDGWEICPENEASIHQLFATYSFGAQCLMGKNDYAYGTNCDTAHTINTHVDYHQCVTVRDCDVVSTRICIRRQHSQPACAAQSWRVSNSNAVWPVTSFEGSAAQFVDQLIAQDNIPIDGLRYAIGQNAEHEM